MSAEQQRRERLGLKRKATEHAEQLVALGLMQHGTVIADDGNSAELLRRFTIQLAQALYDAAATGRP